MRRRRRLFAQIVAERKGAKGLIVRSWRDEVSWITFYMDILVVDLLVALRA